MLDKVNIVSKVLNLLPEGTTKVFVLSIIAIGFLLLFVNPIGLVELYNSELQIQTQLKTIQQKVEALEVEKLEWAVDRDEYILEAIRLRDEIVEGKLIINTLQVEIYVLEEFCAEEGIDLFKESQMFDKD